MFNLMISGCNGKMGQVLTRLCEDDPEVRVVAGVDRDTERRNPYPVYTDPMEYTKPVDCIIDFSNPAALSPLLYYCKNNCCPIVLATTGYSEEQLAEIKEASRYIRIFRSANMSLGVNVLLSLVRQASRVLGNSFDIEIVEKHHNRKLDAPSGTALMLADAASSETMLPKKYVYDRHSTREKRDPDEIGISSVRGGTIVGEHDVIFAGTDEVLTLSHCAYSREIFAHGALKAATFLISRRKSGIYNMEDLVSEVL